MQCEGAYEHILSDRMSSRPMKWSITGTDKMSHLRAYHWSGVDMLELVCAQWKEKKLKKQPERKMT